VSVRVREEREERQVPEKRHGRFICFVMVEALKPKIATSGPKKERTMVSFISRVETSMAQLPGKSD
jgi:hypothetical protein